MSESLEILRKKQLISVEQSTLNDLCCRAPYFKGFEYLNTDCLNYHWILLNDFFQKEIKKYTGTVASFFLQYSPDQIPLWDIVITTYGYVKRYKWIQDYKWNYIIIDEAQAIKNAGRAQTKAVKKEKDNFIVKAKKVKSTRLLKLKDHDLSDMFNIDFTDPPN